MKLKPCPFCGGEMKTFIPSYCEDGEDRRIITHKESNYNCILEYLGCHFDPEKLERQWNTRKN